LSKHTHLSKNWLLVLLSWSFLSAYARAAEYPATGLEWASPEQLRAVPLASMPYSGVELPEQVDLSAHMPPPGDQGRQNSCVGWATAYVLKSYQEQIEFNHPLAQPDGSPNWNKVFSPAYVYNQLNNGRDGGITYIDALNLLSGQGVVPWAEMPYLSDDYRRKPSHAQRIKARPWRIDFWRQINVLDHKEIKAHLNAGYPVMVGALIDEGFFKARKGYIWKNAKGKALGGHAFVLVGYDESKQAFKLINSWGKDWADHGFGWIDYAWFPRVVREGFVAKDALNGSPPAPSPVAATQPMDRLGTEHRNRELPVQEEELEVDALSEPNLQSPPSALELKPIVYTPGKSLNFKMALSQPVALSRNTRLILNIYSAEKTEPSQRLKSIELANSSSPAFQNSRSHPKDFDFNVPISELGLENGFWGDAAIPLAFEIVVFENGFGIFKTPMQEISLLAKENPNPILSQAQTLQAFQEALQAEDAKRIWHLLSTQARQEALIRLRKALQADSFSDQQLRTLLAEGHPLTLKWIWHQKKAPTAASPKAEANLQEGLQKLDSQAPAKPSKSPNPEVQLVQDQGRWKIKSLDAFFE